MRPESFFKPKESGNQIGYRIEEPAKGKQTDETVSAVGEDEAEQWQQTPEELAETLNDLIEAGMKYADPELFEAALLEITTHPELTVPKRLSALRVLFRGLKKCMNFKLIEHSAFMNANSLTDKQKMALLLQKLDEFEQVEGKLIAEIKQVSEVGGGE